MRPRFTIRTLFALTALSAAAIPATLVPGGYIFFLPLLGILILALLWICVYQSWKATHKSLTKYILAVLSVVLLVSAGVFIALIDVAHNRFESVRYAMEQRAAALSIDDPEQFRKIALELRAKLAALPADQRVVSGSSPDLPDEIRALRPILIVANSDYISIRMTPDGGALIAYRRDSTFPRVNCRSIAPDLFYYPH